MSRDDFSAATARKIAERAAFTCAFPNCLAPTSGPALDGSRSVNVGVAAHIAAAAPKGPRYDVAMTPEERADAQNGIWLCSTHAAMIDRDVDRYTLDDLRTWKFDSEDRALKTLGQPRGCAKGDIVSVSQAVRLGADQRALVGKEAIPITTIFNPEDEHETMTWFVQAMVLQFSVEKHRSRKTAMVDHLVVKAHERKEVPEYEPLMLAFPAQMNLFYVEIDSNDNGTPSEFIPKRFYQQSENEQKETLDYPRPIVLDDDLPAMIGLRLNAKIPGMYLISADVVVTSEGDSERLNVMPPQWMIFEAPTW